VKSTDKKICSHTNAMMRRAVNLVSEQGIFKREEQLIVTALLLAGRLQCTGYSPPAMVNRL